MLPRLLDVADSVKTWSSRFFLDALDTLAFGFDAALEVEFGCNDATVAAAAAIDSCV